VPEELQTQLQAQVVLAVLEEALLTEVHPQEVIQEVQAVRLLRLEVLAEQVLQDQESAVLVLVHPAVLAVFRLQRAETVARAAIAARQLRV
jgi:hypothetical protein